MDKAIIVGIYEFIGFHLCEALLQEGIEVYGVNLPMNDSDHIVDEKRLLIGRNSNFQEKDESFLSSFDYSQKDTCIFLDYYSFYMKRQEEKILELVHSNLSQEQLVHSVTIMPIQECMKEISSSYIFYLPTIYGPWQPVNFLFHKALYQSNANHTIADREWTKDAIYVQDTILSILDIIENKKPASYLLKSNGENQWSEIASILSVQTSNINLKSNHEFCKDFNVVEVQGTLAKEGLERQKRYLSQIQKD